MQKETMLTPAELAARWKVTIGALANMRARGIGPIFFKLNNKANGKVRYKLIDVEQYEKEAER